MMPDRLKLVTNEHGVYCGIPHWIWQCPSCGVGTDYTGEGGKGFNGLNMDDSDTDDPDKTEEESYGRLMRGNRPVKCSKCGYTGKVIDVYHAAHNRIHE